MLYTLNTLAWSHPYTLMAVCVLMYALCWMPLLHTRKRENNVPTQAFLATFATPPTPTNVRVIEPAYHTPQALIDACAEAVAWADAQNAPVGEPLDEVEAAIARLIAEIEADEIVQANTQAVAHAVESTKIQHFASSTERMRAQRAAYAAQGLTARGEQPMNACSGTTKAGKSCKRKAQRGIVPEWTQGGFCSYEHAEQFGLGRVFQGEQTIAEFMAANA